MSEVSNVIVDLGPRLIVVGTRPLGTSDNISIEVAEATLEEIEKLKSAFEVRLVRIRGKAGSSGNGEGKQPR